MRHRHAGQSPSYNQFYKYSLVLLLTTLLACAANPLFAEPLPTLSAALTSTPAIATAAPVPMVTPAALSPRRPAPAATAVATTAPVPSSTPPVPNYVTRGFDDYRNKGYEAAVHSWLSGSHYGNAVQMLSRVQRFKNIERLYGRYQNYAILLVKGTPTSSFVYTAMVFERKTVYLGFTSQLRHNQWVLSNFRLDEMQMTGAPAQL